MQTFNLSEKFFLLSFFLLLLAGNGVGQEKYHSNDNLQIVVSGTSTVHDWDMKTSKGETNAVFTLGANGDPTALTALQFTVPAQTLKSEHSSMDNNAYKALKTDKNPNITYTMTSASISENGTVQCQGKLSIAGITLDAPLTATLLRNADKSITIKGSKKISMSDFKIVPPTFMFGTVKTGNDVTVVFTLTLKN